MARTRSISSIEAELLKAESALLKAQERVDFLSTRILDLQKQKQEIEVKQIMTAYKKSDRTLQELLVFLDV